MNIENYKVGETYNYYDNGVFSDSRLYKVKIKSIIPFNEADPVLIKLWRQEFDDYPGIYNDETEYFIEGVIDTGDNDFETIYFVKHRTHELYFSIDPSGNDYCGFLSHIDEHKY